MKSTALKKADEAFGFSWNNRKIFRNYARMAALKLSPFPHYHKKDREKKVFRLSKDLEDLYYRIDDNYFSFSARNPGKAFSTGSFRSAVYLKVFYV